MRNAKKRQRQQDDIARRSQVAGMILPYVRAVASQKARDDNRAALAVLPPIVDADQLEQTRKWIVEGNSVHSVMDAVRHTYPDADATALIVTAVEGLRLAASFNHGIMRGWLLEASKEIYRRSIEANDLATALRSVKQIAAFVAATPEPEESGRLRIEDQRA